MTISEQIKNDLRAYVITGESPPYPLTLSGIADHFEVSAMPVRSAVDSLVEDAFLIRGANGRLRVNSKRKSRSGGKSAAEMRTPLPVTPDKRVMDYVIDLSLRGRDESLREEATAEQFGIGRMVLRRILNRIAGEGFIEHLPRRGWRVCPFREKEMLDYIDIRENLELRALDHASEKMDPEFLRVILQSNTPDEEQNPRLDNRLHRYWIDLADNRYLRNFFDQNAIYFDTLFARAVLDAETVAKRAGEHRVILQALLDSDLSKAKTALSKHILDQRHHVARLLETAR